MKQSWFFEKITKPPARLTKTQREKTQIPESGTKVGTSLQTPRT